ncbi:hypothetical protein EJA72_15245 [Pseudomonas sp. PB120]|nr:hypothetical protein [Pseudomonas sp. PB120]
MDVPASSRAGSLPHWICGVHKTPVGASLLAMTDLRTPQFSHRAFAFGERSLPTDGWIPAPSLL